MHQTLKIICGKSSSQAFSNTLFQTLKRESCRLRILGFENQVCSQFCRAGKCLWKLVDLQPLSALRLLLLMFWGPPPPDDGTKDVSVELLIQLHPPGCSCDPPSVFLNPSLPLPFVRQPLSKFYWFQVQNTSRIQFLVKHNIQKLKLWHPVLSLNGKQMGRKWKQ